MNLKQKFFEDFKIGDAYRIPPKTIDDDHFKSFAELTGDNHPLHYDDQYC